VARLSTAGLRPWGATPDAVLPAVEDDWGIVTAKGLADVPHGAPVRVGGIVAIRQRPETAKGITFATLEDECGLVNVVMPDLSRQEWQTLRLASHLALRGEVERLDGVTHVRARRRRAIGEDSEACALLSKQFA
jgi:error-prone DNA polymerase